MTREQISQAVKLVESKDFDYTKHDDSNLFGCGLNDFKYPVYTTIGAVARLIAWQARTFGGTWDAVELDNMARIARKKFLIIG